MTRTSTRCVRSEPSGSNSRSWMTRSSLAWIAVVSVPISSRKIEPPSASANLPRLVIDAPGERAAQVTEQLRFEQRLGNRRAVHLDERHVTLGAAVVDQARHHLLAGAGLAGDEHRALGFRDELGALNHLLHDAAAADEPVVIELGVTLAEEVLALGLGPQMLRRRGARARSARRARTASRENPRRPSLNASRTICVDPCAVIITICGRSVGVIVCESSRINSSPVMPGIRLSTTNRSKLR